MKNRNIKVLIFVLVALLALNFFLLNLISQERKLSTLQLKKAAQQTSSLNSELVFRTEFIEGLYGSYISSEIKKDIRNNYLGLHSRLESGQKVIVHFNDQVCGSCLLKVFQDLEILSEKIGKENIIATTTMKTEDGQVIRNIDYDFDHYYVETYGLPIERYNQPVVFILDEQLNVRSLYVAELFPDYHFTYFSKVLPNSF